MNQRILHEIKSGLQSLYGERFVRLALFGSQARGDAEAGSDIDVLVVLKGEVAPCEEIARTLDLVATISLEYDETVSCVFVSEKEFETKESPLLINVRREAVFV